MNIKRRFNNDQTVDQSLGKPSIFARDPSASSPDLGLIPFGGGPDINYREIFEQNIQLINHRISQLHKELSYWDLYKLTSQVKTPEELNTVFDGLLPGQALVINTPNNFIQNNETYAKGDVVLKLFDESAVIVKAINAGIYKPDVEHATGSEPYIKFVFQSEMPSDEDKEVFFPIGNFDANSGFIYAWYKDVGDVTSFSFPVESFIKDNVSSNVYPHIRFFTEKKEEIFCDYKLLNSNNNYTVDWTPSGSDGTAPVKYIEVK